MLGGHLFPAALTIIIIMVIIIIIMFSIVMTVSVVTTCCHLLHHFAIITIKMIANISSRSLVSLLQSLSFSKTTRQTHKQRQQFWSLRPICTICNMTLEPSSLISLRSPLTKLLHRCHFHSRPFMVDKETSNHGPLGVRQRLVQAPAFMVSFLILFHSWLLLWSQREKEGNQLPPLPSLHTAVTSKGLTTSTL